MSKFEIVKENVLKAMKADDKAFISGLAKDKFEAYRLYVKSMSLLFETMNSDLEFAIENQTLIFNEISNCHKSYLITAENCIKRCLVQTSENDQIQSMPTRSASLALPKKPCPIIHKHKDSIDILLAEKPMNPVDAAKFKIQKLIQTTNKLSLSPRLTPSEKATMQLRLNRTIEETLNIAIKRESQICQTKTDELTDLLSSIECDMNKYTVFQQNKDLQEVYKSSQLFYHHILKGSKWFNLAQTSRTPEESCLSIILRMDSKHPFTEFILKNIENIISLPNEDSDNIKECLAKFALKIQSLSEIACLLVSFNQYDRFQSQDKLFNLIMDYIFKNSKFIKFIYCHLLSSLNRENEQYNKNLLFLEKNEKQLDILPTKLINKTGLVDTLNEQADQMISLRNIYNPLEKITKLSKLIQELSTKIEEKCPGIEIGGDELMPMLTYICIRCNTFEIFLHIKYIELFMPDDYLMGMEGYILTSIRCALEFCISDTFQEKL